MGPHIMVQDGSRPIQDYFLFPDLSGFCPFYREKCNKGTAALGKHNTKQEAVMHIIKHICDSPKHSATADGPNLNLMEATTKLLTESNGNLCGIVMEDFCVTGAGVRTIFYLII